MIETNVTSTRSLIEKVKCVRRREYESTQFSRNFFFLQIHSLDRFAQFHFFFQTERKYIFSDKFLRQVFLEVKNRTSFFFKCNFPLNALPPSFDLELEANTRFLRCNFWLIFALIISHLLIVHCTPIQKLIFH